MALWHQTHLTAPLATSPKSFRTSAHAGLFLTRFALPSHRGLLLMPCGSTVLCSSLVHTYAPATATSASTTPSVVSGCDKSPRCCNITFTTFRICCCFNYLRSLHSHTYQRWVCARVLVWKTGPSEAWVWMAVCASEQATATGECKHKGPMWFQPIYWAWVIGSTTSSTATGSLRVRQTAFSATSLSFSLSSITVALHFLFSPHSPRSTCLRWMGWKRHSFLLPNILAEIP